jgi:hypothetical protein
MVDEAAYRQLREQTAALPCVFRGALLARQAECELALKKSLAEREELLCAQPTAHINCETLERLFHERATFPLRLHPGAPLTHAMAQRLQCGGLRGLQVALGSSRADVHQMVQQAQRAHGSLTDLPWAQIVEAIMAWQPKRRTGPQTP